MPEITRAELDAAVDGQTIIDRFLDTVDDPPRAGGPAHQAAGRLLRRSGPTRTTPTMWRARPPTSRRLGVGAGDRVVLMMRNVPEFHFIDLGIAALGATSISIYNSSSPEQVAYLTGHCQAKLAIVEDDGFEERFLKVRDELPALETIVNVAHDGVPGAAVPRRLRRPRRGGRGLHARHARHGHLHVGHHRTAQGRDALAPQRRVDRRGLPADARRRARGLPGGLVPADGAHRRAHVHPLPRGDGRLRGHHLPRRRADRRLRARGAPADHVRRAARVGEDLRRRAGRARPPTPTRRRSSTRPWPPPSRSRSAARSARPPPRTTPPTQFLDEAAFAGVRALVGLDAVEYAISGAAPIPAELISWFRAIGVPLSEIYGMSESTGPMTWEPTRVKAGTVGVAFPGTECFLAEDGEVCIRGGNVFARLPRRPGEDRRGPRPRRHAALRRHRRSSTTRATCGSSTARRSSSSPRAARTSAPPTSRPRSR